MFAHLSKSVRRCAGYGVIVLALATGAVRAETAPTVSNKAFVLIEYQVRNQSLFVKLRDLVRDSLKSYKGELVTREKVQPIFGSSPTNVSIIGFATIEDARSWLKSKELAALASQRDEAAKVTTYLVEKLD